MNAPQKVEKVRLLNTLIMQSASIKDQIQWTAHRTMIDMKKAGILTESEVIRINQEIAELRERTESLVATVKCIRHETVVPYND